MKVQVNPLKAWAQEAGVAVRQPEKLTAGEEDWLREAGIGLIVVMAYGHILRDSLLAIPAMGALNLHASILPRFRGASPLNGVIAAGEGETGVSLMRIVRQLDAGAVYAVERFPLAAEETPASLSPKMAAAAARVLSDHLPAILRGECLPREQDHAAATFTRIIEKGDAALDWRMPAVELERRHRALQPWPGSFLEHDGQRIKVGRLTLVEAAEANMASSPPGTIVAIENKDPGQVLVVTGRGTVALRELQRPGGKMLPAAAFLRGYALKVGEVLPSAEVRPLVAEKPFPYRKRRS